jgi:hypothetical protein
MTDVLRGLVRVAFETGAVQVLLKERAEDLGGAGEPRVSFLVDRGGEMVTRRASYKNAPVLVYDHRAQGMVLRQSVGLLPHSRFCCLSDSLQLCFGLVCDADGRPEAGHVWPAVPEPPPALTRLLPLTLASSRARYLDGALCNNVVAALFGDLFRPSELLLFDARSGRELHRIVAELGDRPYQILRFTGLTVCLVHKDGALTKIRVVGRRREKEEPSGCVTQ